MPGSRTPSPVRRRNRSPPTLVRPRSVYRRLTNTVSPRRISWANQTRRNGPAAMRRANVQHMRQRNSIAVGINNRGQLVVIQNP